MQRILLVCWLCFVALTSTREALAQGTNTPPQTWDAVQQTPAGEQLLVQTRDGKKVTGDMVSASDTTLWLEERQQPRALQRADIMKVWRVAPPSRSKQKFYSGIGTGVGLFAGLALAISQAEVRCGDCTGTKVGIIAAITGFPVGGAVIGRALARGKRILIYYAP